MSIAFDGDTEILCRKYQLSFSSSSSPCYCLSPLLFFLPFLLFFLLLHPFSAPPPFPARLPLCLAPKQVAVSWPTRQKAILCTGAAAR